MKKLSLIFALVLSLFFLSGCTSQKEKVSISEQYIMLSTAQNVDGGISQSLVFGVDSNFVNANAKSLKEELEFKQNLIKNVEILRDEFLFSFALVYMANPKEEYKINQGVKLSPVGYYEKGNYVGFEIVFTSQNAWNYYHNISQENNDEKRDNLFYLKQKSKGDFPFSANVGEKYRNAFLNSAKGLSFENLLTKTYKPQFIYNYATFYSRLNSNASVVFKGEDCRYHHLWIEEDLRNCGKVVLSNIIIFRGWWIFFTLLISLGGMTILILFVKLKEKKGIDNYMKS